MNATDAAIAVARRPLVRLNEHWLLAFMLALLHVAIWWDFGGPLSRSMMLAHLGLFLLWQPLWQKDRRVDSRSALAFLVLTFAVVYWLNWWFIFLWLVLLIGLIGGRVFVESRERYASLLALAVVICELLIGCLTPMFGIRRESRTGA